MSLTKDDATMHGTGGGLRNQRGKTRIAWVTFDFPPRQSSGMFRAIKLYKYLDKSKFEVDFITHGSAPRFARAVHDDSLLADVHPTPAVYRVPTIIPHDLLPSLRARWRNKTTFVPARHTGAAAKSGTGAERASRRGLGGTLYRWFAFVVYFPDHLFMWGWLAALKTAWLHVRRPYDVVYTTSYPESAHVAGVVLRALGVRWVVDYRYGGPLWIKEVVGYRKSSLRERVDHHYQQYILRRADQVITQSERIRADFCRTFALDPARVLVIPSGYDETDFEGATGHAPFATRKDQIHLLHLGTLEGVAERERVQMLEALDRLGRELRSRGRALVVHAVGSNPFADAEARAVQFTYHHHGVVVHRNVPAYLLAADCYLLSTWTTSNGGVKGFIPSKLWEYLRAGRPILITGPQDEVWSIVDGAGVGLSLALTADERPSTADLAADLIGRLNARKPLAASVRHYSWQSRANALQNLLLRLVDGPRTAPC